jgi:hypothetical protein
MSAETHHFLSDGWIEAARSLRHEFDDRIPPSPIALKMNVVVTDSPHHEAAIHGHIDTSSGEILIEKGHVDGPELTLTVDYETAHAAFVTRDVSTVMQAFLGGRILVEGDASKLMLLQAQSPSNEASEMYARLDAITTK